MRELNLLLAGEQNPGTDRLEVRSPYDGSVVSSIALGGPGTLEEAAQAAERAAAVMAALAPADRASILERSAQLVGSRHRELAAAISEEAGKPARLAEIEVDRCRDTILEAAHIARHPELAGQDLSGFASGAGRVGLIRRAPVGPVLAITPFNFPLNLVAHKLAPAIAAGCPVTLKPASQTPSPALILGEMLLEAGLPAGALSVIPSRGADAERLASDDRYGLLSFTGSMDVGWHLKKVAWRRRVGLELGGNAAVVVEPDALESVAGGAAGLASRIAAAAFGYAGQSCIAVQRVLVHETVYPALKDALTEATQSIKHGDPADPEVVCGPLIDTDNADRVESWISQALEAGGRLLTGGDRTGNVIAPCLLEEVPHDQPVSCDEVFGPVATLDAYEDFSQALHMANESRYGLQAGIFTSDLSKVRQAWSQLEVGGVIQGDVPTWRTDPMPYGGVKASGVGREGPLYAYREMTEERLLVLRS